MLLAIYIQYLSLRPIIWFVVLHFECFQYLLGLFIVTNPFDVVGFSEISRLALSSQSLGTPKQ
jgi:hypothetical protein